jgi:hypothetical protein
MSSPISTLLSDETILVSLVRPLYRLLPNATRRRDLDESYGASASSTRVRSSANLDWIAKAILSNITISQTTGKTTFTATEAVLLFATGLYIGDTVRCIYFRRFDTPIPRKGEE